MLSKEYLDTARTILRAAQTMTDQHVAGQLKALAEDYERRAEKAALPLRMPHPESDHHRASQAEPGDGPHQLAACFIFGGPMSPIGAKRSFVERSASKKWHRQTHTAAINGFTYRRRMRCVWPIAHDRV